MLLKSRYKPVFLSALILFSFTLACGVFGSSVEPTPLPPVTLTYISLVDDDDRDNAEVRLIEQFEAAHPQITIDQRQYAQDPLTYLTSEAPPDVLLLIADQTTFSAIESGLALDISDLWRDRDLDAAYPLGFRSFGTQQGRHYFLPIAYTWTAVYYNRAIFDQYQLVLPQTWDELLAVSETLWANGVIPFTLPQDDAWSLTMWFDYLTLRLHGPEFYQQLTQGEVAYTDSRVRAVLEVWRDLTDNGYFGEGTLARRQSVGRSLNSLAEGKVAMMLATPIQVIGDLPTQSQAQVDFFAFPQIMPDLPTTEVAASFGYLVPAKTAYPAQASAFLGYLGSADVQSAVVQQFGDEFGVIPARQDLDMTNLSPAIQQGATLVRQADTLVRPFIFAVPEEMNQGAISALRQFLRDPEHLDDVLATMEATRQTAYIEP